MILQEFFVKLGLSVDAASFAKGQLAVNGITYALGKLQQYAVQGIQAGFDALVGFNARAETMRTALAGIIGMNLKKPWEDAKAAADSLYKDLQDQAASTPSTTEELVYFAREVSSAYLHAGGALKDFAKFTADSAVAAKMLGLEGTATLDTTQALQGRAGARDRFARAIIEGELKMSMEKFKSFNEKERRELWEKGINSPTMQAARAEYENTWVGATSNIKDNLAIMFGEMGQELFKDIKKGAILVAKFLKDNKKDIKEFFSSFLTAIKYLAYFVVSLYRAFALLYSVLVKYPVLLVPLIGLFMTLAGVSVGTALATAAAWLLPIAAIAALIIILEDLYVWFRGGDSLIGRIFKKSNGGMPAWLQTIKDVIDGFMHIGDVWDGFKIAAAESLVILKGLILDFFSWLGEQAKNAGKAIINAFNPFSESNGHSWLSNAVQTSGAGPKPEMSLTPALSNMTLKMGDVIVNAPTGDGKDIAGALKKVLDEHLQVVWRTAVAGAH